MIKKSWKNLDEGGIILEAGNSVNFKTGDWKAFKPVWDSKKCVNCMLCYILCPDIAIEVKNGQIIGPNLDYCKGCGICAQECPVKAIKMEEIKK